MKMKESPPDQAEPGCPGCRAIMDFEFVVLANWLKCQLKGAEMFDIGQLVWWAKVGEPIRKGRIVLIGPDNKVVVQGVCEQYVVPMEDIFTQMIDSVGTIHHPKD
jgi:hypothetical protein